MLASAMMIGHVGRVQRDRAPVTRCNGSPALDQEQQEVLIEVGAGAGAGI